MSAMKLLILVLLIVSCLALLAESFDFRPTTKVRLGWLGLAVLVFVQVLMKYVR